MDNLAKLFGTDIPIKFRGKDIDTGEIGYLEFRTIEGAVMLLTENFYAVDPESLGQLCGYDRNGKEVYTREFFRCPLPIGKDCASFYQAQLMPVIINPHSGTYYRKFSVIPFKEWNE